MAETPTTSLAFEDGCPDCGSRAVSLPSKLPAIPDDIDLLTRDYDGFRLTMLEDLAARFPAPRRWTPGDIEVVIVEVLAAALDELSHDLDRLQLEAFLETARSPATVRRLLSFIGYDAKSNEHGFEDKTNEELDRYWLLNPDRMEAARAAGPRAVHTNRRMVTLDDHGTRLIKHPLVEDAAATATWTGAWTVVDIVVIAKSGATLDTTLWELTNQDHTAFMELMEAIEDFHDDESLPDPVMNEETTIRVALRRLVEAERMIGRQAVLHDAVSVPISLSLSVRIDDDYFASEIRMAVEDSLGTQPGGFFAAGRHTFGEDIFSSEIYQTIGAIEGVESVCLNRFKRMGRQYPDRSDSGVITLDGIEVAVCENSGNPSRGVWTLNIHGGRAG